MAIISGTAYWASIQSPNTKFDANGVWTINVSLDAAGLKKAEELGIDGLIKNRGDDQGDYLQFKRKVKRNDGTENNPPKVLDSGKKVIPSDILVGNGSKVNVKFNTYEWKFGGRTGTGLDLIAVQVTDLVEFGEDFEDLSGSSSEDLSDSSSETVDDLDDIPLAV